MPLRMRRRAKIIKQKFAATEGFSGPRKVSAGRVAVTPLDPPEPSPLIPYAPSLRMDAGCLGRAFLYRQNAMCRNIRTLYNFEPPVTDDEIVAAALQYVRKISGFNKPSIKNEAAFNAAVVEIARDSSTLLASLESNAPPKNREEEAAKARERGANRR